MRLAIGQLLLILSIFGVLYGLKAMFAYGDVLIPPIQAPLRFTYDHLWELLGAAVGTYGIAILALTVTVALSFIAGLLLSVSLRLTEIALAWALAWQAFPVVAIAPLLYVLFGDGLGTRLLIAVTVACFPLLLVVLSTISTRRRRVESFYEQTRRWPRGGRLAVRVACSHDAIGNALLGSGALALVGAMVAEFLFSNVGIGATIRHAQYVNNTTLILSALLVISVMNVGYFAVLRFAVHRVFPEQHNMEE